jgi:general secretion pathway protein I
MSRIHLSRARGFTLIEVLVALAIVTVGMAAVLGTLTSSADTVTYLRDKTFATWVALNQIATVRLAASSQAPPSGESDGDTDFAGRKWHWHQSVNGTQVPGMVKIDVSVRPADLKTASADSGWYATMSGIYGDALATPRGDLPDWGSQLLMPQSNTPGTPGSAPGTPGSTPGVTPGTTPQPQPQPTPPTTPQGGS